MTDREMLETIHAHAEPETIGGDIPLHEFDIAGYRIGCGLWEQLEAHLYPEEAQAVVTAAEDEQAQG